MARLRGPSVAPGAQALPQFANGGGGGGGGGGAGGGVRTKRSCSAPCSDGARADAFTQTQRDVSGPEHSEVTPSSCCNDYACIFPDCFFLLLIAPDGVGLW